ncbi:MAG: hypothetical protein ACKV19_29075 [Verrucomicrobiales bacterium]
MNTRVFRLPVVGLVVSAAAAGWCVGHWTAPRPESPTAASVRAVAPASLPVLPPAVAGMDRSEERSPSEVQDTAAAMEVESDPTRRMALLINAVNGLGGDAWASWMEAVDVWLTPFEREYLLVTWAHRDPRSAVTWIAERQSGSLPDDLRAVAGSMAATRPHDLMDLVRDGVGDSAQFGKAAVLALADHHVSLAAETLRLMRPEDATDAAPWVIDRLDQDTLAALLAQLDTGEAWQPVRAAGYAALARHLADTATPHEVREWAEDQLDDPAFSQSGLSAVAEAMPKAEALTWMTQLPLPPAAKGEAVDALFAQWFSDDAQGASAWLGGQTQTPGYDAAAVHVANSIALEDLEGAIAWASSIRDPSLRVDLLASLEAIPGARNSEFQY